jgi:uncharacterized membrane protein
MGVKSIILGILIIVLLAPAIRADYYINEEIQLDSSGFAQIKGETNLDILSIPLEDNKIDGYTDELTTKDDSWLFSYSTDQIVRAYVIKLYLPYGSEIHNVNTESRVSISVEENKHVLTFSGQNESFDINVQYTYERNRAPMISYGTIIVYTLFFILLVAILILIIWFFNRLRNKKKKILNQEKLKTIRLTLNENQLKILDALIERKGEASQTQLRYLTNMAKSSLSRNIAIMAQKSIISKYYNGTSNYIKIHPSLYKTS